MKTERQAHDALTDRREYSPRIWFDPMEEAGLGVDARDSKLASDFAELQGEQQRKVDGWVNAWAIVLVLAVAAWAVFA